MMLYCFSNLENSGGIKIFRDYCHFFLNFKNSPSPPHFRLKGNIPHACGAPSWAPLSSGCLRWALKWIPLADHYRYDFMFDSKHRAQGDLPSFLWLKQRAKSSHRTRKWIVRPGCLCFHLTFVLLVPLKVDSLKVAVRLNVDLFEQLTWHKHTPLGHFPGH